jgi:hypothetical protein
MKHVDHWLLASLISCTDFLVEMVGMCNFPPVYSNRNKFLAICNSSARFVCPFNPNLVETIPSFATPFPFIFSSCEKASNNPSLNVLQSDFQQICIAPTFVIISKAIALVLQIRALFKTKFT